MSAPERASSTYIDQRRTPVLASDAQRADASHGGGGWVVALVVILLIVFIGFIIYTTIKRYQIIDEAIRTGHGDVALGLAAPEIGSGIGSVVSAFRG